MNYINKVEDDDGWLFGGPQEEEIVEEIDENIWGDIW